MCGWKKKKWMVLTELSNREHHIFLLHTHNWYLLSHWDMAQCLCPRVYTRAIQFFIFINRISAAVATTVTSWRRLNKKNHSHTPILLNGMRWAVVAHPVSSFGLLYIFFLLFHFTKRFYVRWIFILEHWVIISERKKGFHSPDHIFLLRFNVRNSVMSLTTNSEQQNCLSFDSNNV